jgi:hypothetical protein
MQRALERPHCLVGLVASGGTVYGLPLRDSRHANLIFFIPVGNAFEGGHRRELA